ncbi:RFC1-domain-containing protein [Fragilariopsis cylindrus CCMP1102]|uniref:RFC1-domain-containing protein n=1 Tax=Fragilariopsis cylindrus CCMP1102 TaxID=635003 RepID=A0A1E7FUA3_9STRA|nr:RFC1-domain-containing protein [Fragilariopsis cylindrus CCMP1102]|eukprot:OEU21741.1 RFC1-domain-containing protein [Fragilariopsis cylindrus CCMP1102]
MDIRSFFGKKPAKKKPAVANSDAATTDTNTATTTTTTTKKTPKEEKKKASVNKADVKISNNNNKNKNKRKVINDDDDEEIVEISPQDYFAKSATTNKPTTKTTNRKITSTSNKDDEDDDIDGVVSSSPLKKIRSSPRRSSTTATASVSAKSETVVEEKDHGGRREGQSTALTYKKLKDRGKSMQKDEMLRVNLFDAAKLIMEGPRDLAQADDKTKLNSLFKRSDAFFVDYSFTGLIVQQNYPKIVQSQYLRVKQKGDPVEELRILERLHDAALSMSDYNLCESQIRGGDLNWSLLPTAAILAVKTGYHAGGESGGFLGGFPEFTSWMGKNSSMGKNYRLLNELSQHMNYKVSANAQELRRTYIPVMRDRIFTLLKNGDADSNKEVIAFMDEYALVREQGGGGIKKKKDDDSSVDEVDDDKELEKLAAQFKKKGRKKAAAKPKKKGKGKK